MTKEEKDAITDAIREVIESSATKETDAEKKRRIMAITNTTERQKAIRENIGLFSGDLLIGGKKIEDI